MYNNYMFTDLLIKYNEQKDNLAIKEAINRLKFCGYSDSLIDQILTTELMIINRKKGRITYPISNSYIWLPNIDNKFFSPFFNTNKENYIYKSQQNINKETLTLGELICVFDEAYHILNFCKTIPPKIYPEILEIAEHENDDSWVIREFYSRIEKLRRTTLKNKPNDKKVHDFNKTLTFYDNELQILFNQRWKGINEITSNWKPYSNEYFDWLKNN